MKGKRARFEVDTQGMRALHAGREPWQLVKELVSNAWDEPTAGKCLVSLKSEETRRARLDVFDDGQGFARIEDAWTLMGHTPKRGNPTVRGRFNIGEKEILSVAISAQVKTAGKVITFPESGGRRVTKGGPGAGTLITCVLPWGPRQVENTVARLGRLLPPKGAVFAINEYQVPYQEPIRTVEATLETVLQESPDDCIRATRRKTTVEIYRTEGNGELFEMGIPVQDIETPYLVNVGQKIPLPPNRDTVKDSYLQDIYRIVLEAMQDEIKEPSATWVRQAVEDSEISAEVVKKVMVSRYGDKAVLWSSDTIANERALESGYTLVHPRTLSPAERDAMQNLGGLVHSSEAFGLSHGSAEYLDEKDLTPGMRCVRDHACMLAKELCGHMIWVRFYKMWNGYAAASYSPIDRVLSFDVSKLGGSWFDTIGYEQTGLILHELGHDTGNGHDAEYKEHLSRLGGKAYHLALNSPKIARAGMGERREQDGRE